MADPSQVELARGTRTAETPSRQQLSDLAAAVVVPVSLGQLGLLQELGELEMPLALAAVLAAEAAVPAEAAATVLPAVRAVQPVLLAAVAAVQAL